MITLYGPAYSVYTRIVRVVLEEKATAYRLEEVDFISGGMPEAQKERHPFGIVPALDHDGEIFFETAPICVYLDEVLEGPSLRPADPAGRAHVAATVSVLDQYIWPDIRELTTQAIFTPYVGGWPDDTVTARMVKRLTGTLAILQARFVETGLLGGPSISLADLHAAPMFAYLAQTVEGQMLLRDLPGLASWWSALKDRPSLTATQFDLKDYPWARRESPD